MTTDRTEANICSLFPDSAYSRRRITSDDKTLNTTRPRRLSVAATSHYPECPCVPGERERHLITDTKRREETRSVSPRCDGDLHPHQPHRGRRRLSTMGADDRISPTSVERCGAPRQRSARHFLQGLERPPPPPLRRALLSPGCSWICHPHSEPGGTLRAKAKNIGLVTLFKVFINFFALLRELGIQKCHCQL